MKTSVAVRRTLFAAAVLLTPGVLPGAANSAAGAAQADPLGAIRVYLEKETTGLPGRVELTIGALDPRVQLSPCSRVEPFLAPGTRLWGRAMVGLRCLDSPGWTAWLPVEVKVWGAALVAAAPLAAGQTPAGSDLRVTEIELTRERPVLSAMNQVDDKVLVRPVPAGQVLRPEHFRQRPAVSQGDYVKVVYRGAGFTVSTEARAMADALAGQTLRVQTGSGKVLSGTVQPGRIVEIPF